MTMLSLLPPGYAVGPRLGLLADSVNDASSTHKVYLLAGGLAALGIALVAITIWFWRTTRHDPELLAPLEAIGARRFRKLDGGTQQALLDGARPAEATPMRWGVRRGGASGEPEIDLRANMRSGPTGYDDLHDPALIAVAIAETAEDGTLAAAAPVEPVAEPLSPTDDIDSALAAVGAKVDFPSGAPAPVVVAPAVVAPVAGDPPEAEPALPIVPSVAARPAIGIADAAWDGSAALMPSAAVRDVPPAVAPLVIVPVDHEVRPSAVVPMPVEAQRRVVSSSPREADPEDATSAAELPSEDESASIDPLLRMFNRNDG